MIQLFRPIISEEAIEAVAEVLRSGWIGLGPKTEAFEKMFAEYMGARYAVGLNSATAGLHLALKVADVGPGDEVITTPLTFVSTNHAILYCGGTPVFADIDPQTCNIDVSALDALTTERTKAVICVHYGGYPCDIYELEEFCQERGLVLIHDAAHACGSSYEGTMIGAFLDLTVFSFHAVKNLPAGDGGMVTTDNRDYYERLKRLRWLGIDKDTYQRTVADKEQQKAYAWQYDVPEVGFKYHMNDIAAAIGMAMLPHLENGNARRREIARMYQEGLVHPDIIRLPRLSDRRITTAQHLYAIQVKRRNDLVTKLKINGVAPGVHYIPNNLFPMYSIYGEDTPQAWDVADHLISLPLHLGLSDEDVQRTIRIINDGW